MKIFINRDFVKSIKNACIDYNHLPNYEKNRRDIVDLSNFDGEITESGIIINSYINGDGDSLHGMPYQLIYEDDKVLHLYRVNPYDKLVVEENYGLRILRGLDNKIYVISAEYFNYKNKRYAIFPNYLIKYDGSIESIKGSAQENFIRLRGIKEYQK